MKHNNGLKRKLFGQNLRAYYEERKQGDLKVPVEAENDIKRKANEQLFALVPKVALCKNANMDNIVKSSSKKRAISSPSSLSDFNTTIDSLDSYDTAGATIGDNSSPRFDTPVEDTQILNDVDECNVEENPRNRLRKRKSETSRNNTTDATIGGNASSEFESPAQETQILNSIAGCNVKKNPKTRLRKRKSETYPRNNTIGAKNGDNASSGFEIPEKETQILNGVDECTIECPVQETQILNGVDECTIESPVQETQILNGVDECTTESLVQETQILNGVDECTTESPVQETQILNGVDECTTESPVQETQNECTTESPVQETQTLNGVDECNVEENARTGLRKRKPETPIRNKIFKKPNRPKRNTCPENDDDNILLNDGAFKIEMISKPIASPEIQILFPKSLHDKISNTNIRISIDLEKLDFPLEAIANRLNMIEKGKTSSKTSRASVPSEISSYFATFASESPDRVSSNPIVLEPTGLRNLDSTSSTSPTPKGVRYYTPNDSSQCVLMSAPVSCADLEPAFTFDYALLQESLAMIQSNQQNEINPSTFVVENVPTQNAQNASEHPLSCDLNCFASNANATNECGIFQELQDLMVEHLQQSNFVQSDQQRNDQHNPEICNTNAETLVSSTINESETYLPTEKNNSQNLPTVNGIEGPTIVNSGEQSNIVQDNLTSADVENLQMECIREFLTDDVPPDDTLSIYAESLLETLEANLTGENENQKNKSQSNAQTTKKTFENNNEIKHWSARNKKQILPNCLSFLYNNTGNLLSNYKIPKITEAISTETDEGIKNNVQESEQGMETNVENSRNDQSIASSTKQQEPHSTSIKAMVYKVFDNICWKFVAGSCRHSSCKFSHKYISPEELKERLLILDKYVLRKAYDFILRNNHLFSRYFTTFCDVYATKKIRAMICLIIKDSERFLDTFHAYKDVVRILMKTGYDNVTAIKVIIDQITNRKFEVIDFFIELIVNDNILEHLSLLETLRCVPNYNFNMSAINKIADICHVSQDIALSQFLLKVMIFNTDKKDLETYKGTELLKFLQMILSSEK